MPLAGRTLTCMAVSAVLLLSPAAAVAVDGDDLSARELAEQAQDNLLDAESVRLELTDRSKEATTNEKKPTSMDLSLDRDGNCAGELKMGKNGGSVEIVKRGERVWMKPDTAFWKAQVPGGQGDVAAQLFKDRYIYGTTKDAMLKGLADTCDLSSFQRDIDTGPGAGAALTKGEETSVDDTKVIPLRGEKDGKDSTLYVTSDSPHRLVRAIQKGDGTDITLNFRDYDKPVPSGTPSPDETVDVGKLREELGSA